MSYDFIDYNEFNKNKKNKKDLLFTKFDELNVAKDRYLRKYFYRAYTIADGNIKCMSEGVKLTRNTVYKYLKKLFGKNFKEELKKYHLEEQFKELEEKRIL